MKATIRNKLAWGMCGVLVLLTSLIAIGSYAVFSLRKSAQEATRVGGRLNELGLEIQVHNLEAQLRVKSYLLEVKTLGPEKARKQYLEGADREILMIESLASTAVAIAPTADKREKFQAIVDGTAFYGSALAATVKGAQRDSESLRSYEKAAGQLDRNAEAGEAAGRESSRTAQEEIDRISLRSATMAIGVSLAGLLLGMAMSYKLSRAILVPVEHLKKVAENVSFGNLDIAVRRHSSDEIGDLTDSFSRMVTAVKFFRMEAELFRAQAERSLHKVNGL